jgi:hypothetical protein
MKGVLCNASLSRRLRWLLLYVDHSRSQVEQQEVPHSTTVLSHMASRRVAESHSGSMTCMYQARWPAYAVSSFKSRETFTRRGLPGVNGYGNTSITEQFSQDGTCMSCLAPGYKFLRLPQPL